MENTQKYINQNQEKFLNELLDLLRIPSISADPKYTNDVLRCAQNLKAGFDSIGLDNVEVISTKGHPIVYGERIIDESFPTILIYGHYDVQPPDPLDLWESDPFEPEIRNEKIYARGARWLRL